MSLATLAGALLDDPSIGTAVELQSLFAAFSAEHPLAPELAAAWTAHPPGQSPGAWIAVLSTTPALSAVAGDLALTALFGAVYVGRKVKSANQPGWIFAGRFWPLIGSHPPGLSAGPFGHWAYPPPGGAP